MYQDYFHRLQWPSNCFKVNPQGYVKDLLKWIVVQVPPETSAIVMQLEEWGIWKDLEINEPQEAFLNVEIPPFFCKLVKCGNKGLTFYLEKVLLFHNLQSSTSMHSIDVAFHMQNNCTSRVLFACWYKLHWNTLNDSVEFLVRQISLASLFIVEIWSSFLNFFKEDNWARLKTIYIFQAGIRQITCWENGICFCTFPKVCGSKSVFDTVV